MYCIRCGVEMEDGEKQCPLCGTTVVHPDFTGRVKDEMYPSGKLPTAARRSKIWQIILAVAFALAVTIVVLCDLQINHAVSWSGYVIGALVVGYMLPVLYNIYHMIVSVQELLHPGSTDETFETPAMGGEKK